jgi:hypothetical protein
MSVSFKRSAQSVACFGALSFLLTACGGGSGSSTVAATTAPASTQLTGTAATGAPISGVVKAIDINGKVSPSATTTALGAFVVDVSGMTAPFILNIVGTTGAGLMNLNSIATAAGQTVNITPLTDLIVATASGQPAGGTLASLCAPVNNATPAACLSALSAASTTTNLTAAVNAVKAMIAPLNTGNVDPLNGAFVANGTGLDKVLDQILVTPAHSQGATATVTLIATNAPLGTVVLPATAGTASTIPVPTPPSSLQLATATAAASALPEIQTCLNSFNALYAAPMTAPTRTRVAEFVDSSFQIATLDATGFVTQFSGSNAIEGFFLKAIGLSRVDMSPFSPTELALFDQNAVNASGATIFSSRTTTAIDVTSQTNTAWVRMNAKGNAGLINVKMVKGSAYTGCAGGWKLAGTQHIEMHMDARVNRIDGNITREWAMHIAYADVNAISGAQRVKIGGPGLSVYDAAAANGVGAATPVDLVAGNTTTMTLANPKNVYPFGTDAIRSCQDLKAEGKAATENGAPCMDETAASPGQIYRWYLRTGTTGAAPIVAAFPFQTSSVPLSKAFVQANASSIFATIGTTTPSNLAGFAAKLNTSLVGQITINYTLDGTYGATPEHCGVLLFAANSAVLLGGEQSARASSTACTMSAPYAINTTSTVFGINAAPASGIYRVATTVLGNQAVTMQTLSP